MRQVAAYETVETMPREETYSTPKLATADPEYDAGPVGDTSFEGKYPQYPLARHCHSLTGDLAPSNLGIGGVSRTSSSPRHTADPTRGDDAPIDSAEVDDDSADSARGGDVDDPPEISVDRCTRMLSDAPRLIKKKPRDRHLQVVRVALQEG